MMTVGFCNSLPPTPPSASAAAVSESFVQGLKKVSLYIKKLLLHSDSECVSLSLLDTSVDVVERLRAPNSNSGVSDQQSVGSNPQP